MRGCYITFLQSSTRDRELNTHSYCTSQGTEQKCHGKLLNKAFREIPWSKTFGDQRKSAGMFILLYKYLKTSVANLVIEKQQTDYRNYPSVTNMNYTHICICINPHIHLHAIASRYTDIN